MRERERGKGDKESVSFNRFCIAKRKNFTFPPVPLTSLTGQTGQKMRDWDEFSYAEAPVQRSAYSPAAAVTAIHAQVMRYLARGRRYRARNYDALQTLAYEHAMYVNQF